MGEYYDWVNVDKKEYISPSDFDLGSKGVESMARRNSLLCALLNEYGVDLERPFEGLFLRNGRDFRYTINHTKRIFYSFQETKILDSDGTENDYVDPLPLLMGFGRSMNTGYWVGDILGVADEAPDGYTLLKTIHLDW